MKTTVIIPLFELLKDQNHVPFLYQMYLYF